MRPKIAIVTPTFPPYRGGIGAVAERDACQLAALGFDVHVFTPHWNGVQEKLPYRVHQLVSLFRYGNAAFVPGVASLLSSYSLVLLHYPFFGGAEPLWFEKKIFGKGRLILMYHMDVVGRGLLGVFFRLHTRLWMSSILRSAERILVTSFDYARESNLGGLLEQEPTKFRELAPSVNVHRFIPGKSARGGSASGGKSANLLDPHHLHSSDFVLLSVGGLDSAHYFKGVPNLLRALTVHELHHVKAIIVGDGNLRLSYESLARKLGVGDRVIFAGNVSDAELPDYYRLADVFVFPSLDRSEAFGIAILEALASGIPVVASRLPGVRTLVQEGKTGILVTPGSASSLADGIATMLLNEELRRRCGDNGRQMAVAEYSDEKRQEKWRDLL